MLRFYVDFNYCDDVDLIVVRADLRLNAEIDESSLIEDLRVLLYDESLECEAILRRGKRGQWVAKLDRGTLRDIPEDQWGRLDTAN